MELRYGRVGKMLPRVTETTMATGGNEQIVLAFLDVYQKKTYHVAIRDRKDCDSLEYRVDMDESQPEIRR